MREPTLAPPSCSHVALVTVVLASRPARCRSDDALMSVVNSQDEWCQPLLPAEGGRFVVAHGWGRDLLDVGDKL